jgi:hypothetical protein
MANITTYDGFIERISNGYSRNEIINGIQIANPVTFGAANAWSQSMSTFTKTIPTLEAGVSAYIPTAITANTNTASTSVLVGRFVELGSLDIATPTFTDGSTMGTRTVGGLSYNVSGILVVEVTTALSASPGNFTVTYVDQDGNAAETTTSRSFGASAPIGSSAFHTLNTDDYAVQDITTATRTGGTTPTGVVKFWGVEIIALLEGKTIQTSVAKADLLNDGLNLVRLGSGDVVRAIWLHATAAGRVIGDITYVGDTV